MRDRKYFIGFSNNWSGPYSINELKTFPLTKSNKVWTSGYDDWVRLESVAELRDIVDLIPPPLKFSDEQKRRDEGKIESVVRGLDDVGSKYEWYSLLFQLIAVAFLAISVAVGGLCLYFAFGSWGYWGYFYVSLTCFILSVIAMFISSKGNRKYVIIRRLMSDVVMIGSAKSEDVERKLGGFNVGDFWGKF
jgi:hypothetical protein